MTDAITATSTVVKALKLVKTARDAVLTTGDQRLEDWIQEEVREAVFRRLPEVERKCQELIDAGVDVKLTDVAHVGNHVARGWSTAADPRKRKLLEDAFVRSFDRELYESGLLNTLWERLERLSYGDLRLLRDIVEVARASHGQTRRGMHELTEELSLAAFHAANLQREALMVLNRVNNEAHALPTDLGVRLYRLAWEQLPEPGAAVDSEEK